MLPADAVTFSVPTSWLLVVPLGAAAGFGVLVSMVVVALGERHVLAAVLTILATIWFSLPTGWHLTRLARKVVISENGISATPIIGRSVSLRWDEIASAEIFSSNALASSANDRYRLIGRGGRSIAFTSEMAQFGRLRSLISAKTDALERPGEPTRAQKVIFRGI